MSLLKGPEGLLEGGEAALLSRFNYVLMAVGFVVGATVPNAVLGMAYVYLAIWVLTVIINLAEVLDDLRLAPAETTQWLLGMFFTGWGMVAASVWAAQGLQLLLGAL